MIKVLLVYFNAHIPSSPKPFITYFINKEKALEALCEMNRTKSGNYYIPIRYWDVQYNSGILLYPHMEQIKNAA